MKAVSVIKIAKLFFRSGLVLALTSLWPVWASAGEQLFAVIPTHIIYPGEEISSDALQEVEVTNPDLAGDYAQSITQVAGLVTKRTLLPGRVIYLSGLREPFAVVRGSAVKLVYDNHGLVITASGSPLQDAAIGDLIRVRNTDTGITVSGTVMADGTIKVVEK